MVKWNWFGMEKWYRQNLDLSLLLPFFAVFCWWFFVCRIHFLRIASPVARQFYKSRRHISHTHTHLRSTLTNYLVFPVCCRFIIMLHMRSSVERDSFVFYRTLILFLVTFSYFCMLFVVVASLRVYFNFIFYKQKSKIIRSVSHFQYFSTGYMTIWV